MKWAAIHAVAVALGRHVWGLNPKGKFFANLYIVMIAPPGSGKTQTEDLIRPFLNDLGVHISAQHISKAAMIDEMNDADASRRTERYHHLVILSSEFAETFPDRYDIHLLAMLQRWWDCPEEFKERKRHLKETITIRNVCCNILTGIPPGILAYSFPPAAWHGGFLARTIFVYVAQPEDLYLWAPPDDDAHTVGEQMDKETYTELVASLESIANTCGLMEETESFREEYVRWKRDDAQQPRPKHPRLAYYNRRREHQLIKLSLISAASRGSTVLEGHDFLRARAWLEEVEENLDEIFLEMQETDELVLMRDLNHFLWRVGKGKPVVASRAWQFLTGKVPTQRIEIFIRAAHEADYLRVSTGPSDHVLLTPTDLEAENI